MPMPLGRMDRVDKVGRVFRNSVLDTYGIYLWGARHVSIISRPSHSPFVRVRARKGKVGQERSK